MKTKLILFGIFLLCMAKIAAAQDLIYGPSDPPPKSLTFTYTGDLNDEEIGLAAGKNLYFSQVELALTTDVYIATPPGEVKLSLDGSDFATNEILQFDGPASDLASGILVWTGTTNLPGSSTTVYTKFTLVATVQGSGDPVALETPDAITGSSYPGGILHISNGVAYQLNLRFDAGYSTGSMEPALTFYNNEETVGNNAYSSYDYGWYWINDAPQVEEVDTLMVMEGDTAWLGIEHLLVTDSESNETAIYISTPSHLMSLPAFGSLQLDYAPVAPGDTFTVDQLNNNRICYIHDDSETKKDSIAFYIFDSDGKYYSETKSAESVLYLPVLITPVNDPPVISVLEIFQPNEGEETTITPMYLKTVDNESDSTKVVYTFDPDLEGNWPLAGTVRLSGIPLSSGNQFKQHDIDAGNISYYNDGSETMADGFIFMVEDESGNKAIGPNEQDKVFFEIAVTLVNDPPKISKNLPTEVEQWGVVMIDANHLAATDEESPDDLLTFTLDLPVEVTQFGSLYKEDTKLSPGDAFSMQDILDGRIKYINGGSHETTDMIVVQISDEQGAVASDQGFTTFSHMIQITLTGIHNHAIQDVQIYPNPGHGIFTISWEEELKSYALLNTLGQELISGDIQGLREMKLDLTSLHQGMYMIRMKSTDGKTLIRKILIK